MHYELPIRAAPRSIAGVITPGHLLSISQPGGLSAARLSYEWLKVLYHKKSQHKLKILYRQDPTSISLILVCVSPPNYISTLSPIFPFLSNHDNLRKLDLIYIS